MDINDKIRLNFKDINKIENKTFFVTGGTGLIGSTLISFILSCHGKVIALARNEEKAKTFSFYNQVEWIFQDMAKPINISGGGRLCNSYC